MAGGCGGSGCSGERKESCCREGRSAGKKKRKGAREFGALIKPYGLDY